METDFKALLDRMEVLVDRLFKPKTYCKKCRKKYHKLLHTQIKYLRAQLK